MKYIGLLFLFIFSTHTFGQSQHTIKGEEIYMTRCSSCHSIDKDVIGPALKDLDKRRSEEWIIDFVSSSQNVIKSGDPVAIELFERYNKILMPDHKDLSKEDIQDIVSYIQVKSSQEAKPTELANIVDAYRPYGDNGGIIHGLIYLDIPGDHKPVDFSEIANWFVLGGILFMLIALLCLSVKSNDLIDTFRKEEQEKQDN